MLLPLIYLRVQTKCIPELICQELLMAMMFGFQKVWIGAVTTMKALVKAVTLHCNGRRMKAQNFISLHSKPNTTMCMTKTHFSSKVEMAIKHWFLPLLTIGFTVKTVQWNPARLPSLIRRNGAWILVPVLVGHKTFQKQPIILLASNGLLMITGSFLPIYSM